MNYISDEILTILVQEVYESKGTLDVEVPEIVNSIKQKFTERTIPNGIQGRVIECIKNLKDFDPSQKHVTVFDDAPFSISNSCDLVEYASDSGMGLCDDEMKEIEEMLEDKEDVSIKPEPEVSSTHSRRRAKPRRSYVDIEEDEAEKKMAKQIYLQDHNKMVRQAQAEESEGMALLRKYTRCCPLGTKGLRGLYNITDPIEREKELIRRLHEFGETWEGDYPTLSEIRLADLSTKRLKEKSKKELQKPREGGRKRKRGRRKRSLYSLSYGSDYSEGSD